MSAFKDFCRKIAGWSSKHAPQLLTGGTIVGLGATIFFTRKAAVQEKEIVEEIQPADWKEYVKAVWKVYIPTALSAAGTVACSIGSERISTKRIAGLTAAYEMSESAMRLYKEKVIEQIGKNKEKNIEEQVKVEQAKQAYASPAPIILTGNGDALYLDAMSQRVFRSSKNAIDRAVNSLNSRLRREMWVCVNDFYYEIGLTPCVFGDILGWDLRDCDEIDIRWANPQYGDNNEPIGVIGFDPQVMSLKYSDRCDLL